MRNFLGGRWWLLLAALVAVLGLWRRAERPRPGPAVAPGGRAERPVEPAPAAPPPAPQAAAPATPAASSEVDPYGMPPPSPEQIRAVPEPRAITEQEHRQTQQAARELVEQGIARLAAQAQEAARSGDRETAQRNQLRVARLRRRLAELQQQTVPAPGQP